MKDIRRIPLQPDKKIFGISEKEERKEFNKGVYILVGCVLLVVVISAFSHFIWG